MAKPKAGEVVSVAKRSVSSTQKKTRAVKEKAEKTPRLKKKASTTQKIVVTALKEDGRKLQIIENIAKKRTEPEVLKSYPKKTMVVASRINLALMVPFKLPLDHASLVSNVARYAGTAFVVVGAILALSNINAVLTQPSESFLVAQLASNTSSGEGSYGDQYGTGTTQMYADEDPDVSIRPESPSSVLSGTVPINVTVAYADRVDLLALHKETNAVVQIGTLTKVGDLAWRTYWRTTGADDGTYRLKAVVKNRFGTYTYTQSNDYQVQNYPLEPAANSNPTSTPTTQTPPPTASTDSSETASSTATGSATTTNTTTSPATTTRVASLKASLSMSSPLKGEVEIRAFTEGASKMPVYYRKVNTSSYTLLGYATLHSTGEWRFKWDTARIPDGDYDLRVQAIFTNGTANTQHFPSLTIKNTESSEIISSSTAPTTIATNIPTNTTSATAPLEPTISLQLSKVSPLKDDVDVYVNSSPLSFVEIYVLPERSLTPRFLGLAEKQSETSWRYRFDTRMLPNGTYTLFAKTRHQYGDTEGGKTSIRIYNDVVADTQETNTAYVETLRSAGEEVKVLSEPVTTSITESSEAPTSPMTMPVLQTTLREELSDEVADEGEKIIESFEEKLHDIMREYSRALRSDEQDKVRELQNQLEELREEVLRELPISQDRNEIITRINEDIGLIIKDLRERVERSETIIKERVGESVTKDSDGDGISDYDEVNLYETDPFSSDSDQDGFIDGVEVLNGFDPKDDAREANVQYESPREVGVVREDILTVEHITTIEVPEASTAPKAHIAGKALPNSFVTLYIFSTPIVITVKSDSNGNWSYVFDKELENGEHEIYVGITDNAGRIVAKSNPLSFVKTAEAFTPIGEEASIAITETNTEPSLISRQALLAVASLAVVSIGLVLILLGLHVRPKEEELQLIS